MLLKRNFPRRCGRVAASLSGPREAPREALQLRKDDLEIEALLDRQPNETHVRRELESFNARIVRARMQLQGGPPVITRTRDVEAEVAAWRERRRHPAQRLSAALRDTPYAGWIVALTNYNTVV